MDAMLSGFGLFPTEQQAALRLYPSELNRLIVQEAGDLESEHVALLNAQSSLSLSEFPFYAIKRQTEFCVFTVAKDSPDREVEMNLPYVPELLEAIKDQPRFQNVTLLIPMRQSCPFVDYYGLSNITRRAHIVLVEVNLAEKRICVHDSQTKSMIYQDNLASYAERLGFSYKYNAYGVQEDDVLCGYYVHRYIKAILNNRSCEKISIPLRKSDSYSQEAFFIRNDDEHEHYTSKAGYMSHYAGQ